MKRIRLSILVVMALVIGIVCMPGGVAFAQNAQVVFEYDVMLSTYNVVGSTTDFTAGGYPDYTGNARMHYICLTNSGDTDQVITIYDTATSTTAANLIWTINLAGISDENGIFTKSWPFALCPIWTTFAIKKSTTATDVSCYINYR